MVTASLFASANARAVLNVFIYQPILCTHLAQIYQRASLSRNKCNDTNENIYVYITSNTRSIRILSRFNKFAILYKKKQQILIKTQINRCLKTYMDCLQNISDLLCTQIIFLVWRVFYKFEISSKKGYKQDILFVK